MSDFVDDLIANPGLYTGPQTDPTGEGDRTASVARILVTPLPGGSGVRMEYEVLAPEHIGHVEHAVLARTTTGVLLITSHTHADVTTVLRETEPGVFPADEGEPFPMAIELQVPEPGRLVYLWSHGMPGGEATLRDRGDLRLVSS